MKLGHKLLLAPALTALVMLAVGQIDSLFMSKSAEKAQAGFSNQIEQFKTINDVQDQVAAIHTGVYRTMAIVGSLDDAKLKTIRTELSQQLQGVERVLGNLSKTGLDPSSLDKARDLTRQYLKQADSALDLASVDPNTGVAALQTADATFQTLSQHFVGVIKQVDQFYASQSEADRVQAGHAHWLLSALALGVAVVAIWASWLALRRVANELARASALAQEVASGNLNVSTATQRQDELGDLLRALGSMQSSLNKVVEEIRSSSDHIGVSSSQIASGTQDLANRTEQAASNLEQTASSMEELTATVKQSADAARQANQLASTAAEVASRGGAVVSQVVTTMEDINHSSRKIADIIGVIDSIAFQTNILALNAAVEAARAGEAGRGFAVVASEVRNLAGRSAQAAKEIKDLINASVEKVQSGSQLVQDAGKTMGEIVASVQRVTDVIGEITAASGEQSNGIGQVNTAVNQLDQMTQQNAALVEQSTAAAESLRDQAQRLTQVVSIFKTSGGSHHAPSIAPSPKIHSAPVASPAPARLPAPKAVSQSAKMSAPQAPTHAVAKRIAISSTLKSAEAKKSPKSEPVQGATTAPKAKAAAGAQAASTRPASAKPELKRPQAATGSGGATAATSTRVTKAPAADDGDWETF